MHSPSLELPERLSHLRPHFEAGDLWLVPSELAHKLDTVLMAQPWLGTSIDWRALGGGTVFKTQSNEELALKLRTTRFGSHRYALAFFKAEDPLVGGPMSNVIENLDSIYWKAPGVRFVFGAELDKSRWEPATTDFLQYSGTETIIVSR